MLKKVNIFEETEIHFQDLFSLIKKQIMYKTAFI